MNLQSFDSTFSSRKNTFQKRTTTNLFNEIPQIIQEQNVLTLRTLLQKIYEKMMINIPPNLLLSLLVCLLTQSHLLIINSTFNDSKLQKKSSRQKEMEKKIRNVEHQNQIFSHIIQQIVPLIFGQNCSVLTCSQKTSLSDLYGDYYKHNILQKNQKSKVGNQFFLENYEQTQREKQKQKEIELEEKLPNKNSELEKSLVQTEVIQENDIFVEEDLFSLENDPNFNLNLNENNLNKFGKANHNVNFNENEMTNFGFESHDKINESRQFFPLISNFDAIKSHISGFVGKNQPLFSNVLVVENIHLAKEEIQNELIKAMKSNLELAKDFKKFLPSPFVLISIINEKSDLPWIFRDYFHFCVELHSKLYVDIKKTFISPPLFSSDEYLSFRELTENVFCHSDILQYSRDISQEFRNFLFDSPSLFKIADCLIRFVKPFALLHGFNFVIPDHLKMIVPFVVSHRIQLKSNNLKGNINEIITKILEQVSVPI
ncbi:moxr protein [Anaeramoeba ignava]|uniref:magnesium chelatase n=1 Tax=Anaeramoeba ignava TaxID=1746090 RepID=A0A9Q0LQK6_ANAIG|nr:moxr protein [Anaeramoeba ignava]